MLPFIGVFRYTVLQSLTSSVRLGASRAIICKHPGNRKQSEVHASLDRCEAYLHAPWWIVGGMREVGGEIGSIYLGLVWPACGQMRRRRGLTSHLPEVKLIEI